ncbi:hypothetical protein K7432_013671 [Basidiobolus ranarum]|uniref:SH3 domain-containing protein n=1 Tax=Basidiobolus ranarum TaxID=34480 RepID=A0ABR2WIU3_9FUNG
MNMPAFTRMNNQSSDLDGNGNPADTASGRPNMSTNMSYQPNRFDSMATFPAAARIQDIREEPRENEAMRIKPDPIMHNQEAHFIDSIRSAKPLPTPNREQPNTNTTTTVLPNFQNEPINITNPTYHKPLNHALDISQNSVNNSENVVTSSMAPLSTIHRPTPAVPLKDETNLSSAITPRDNGIPVNNERSKPYSPASKLTETPKSFNERGNEKPPYNVSRKIGSEEVYPEMITNTPSDKISSRGSNVTSPKFDIANMPGLVNTMKNRSTNQDMNDLKPPKNNISHHENLSKSSVLSNASGMSEGGILGEPLEETVIVGFNQSQSTLSSHASDGPVVQHTLNSKDPFDSRLVMTAVSSYMPQRPNEIMVLPDDKLLISEEVGEEWLVGYNNSRNPGVKGYFPRGCVVGGYFN